jgi:hypothetical protein
VLGVEAVSEGRAGWYEADWKQDCIHKAIQEAVHLL